jgi:hypothetical protein
MPEECASIRSIARCVLPVLVGPSTAVTPEPRARSSRSALGENEIDIESPAEAVSRRKGGGCLAQPRRWKALCLTCGTSLERIAAESATPPPFVFVHCDIWHCRPCCIPDRVELGPVGACLNGTKDCPARDHHFDRSQEAMRCVKWGRHQPAAESSAEPSLRFGDRMRRQRRLGNRDKFCRAQ